MQAETERTTIIWLGWLMTSLTILFQRPITLSEDDDPESELNGIYAECNGDVTYNTCKSVSLTNESVVFEVQYSIITVDLSDVKGSVL